MINWNPALKTKADSLLKELESLPNQNEFVLEVQKQATERLMELIGGLESYTHLPAPNIAPTPYTTIWQEGETSLFDYISIVPSPACGEGLGRGNEEKQKILLIPSLINKSYILDLTENTSMIKFLKDSGFHPLMLDWGNPKDEDKPLTLDDYIERITAAIDEINEPVVLAGYCMGGLMALSAALQDQKKLKGLALLATPWDFHSPDNERMLFTPPDIEKFSNMLDGLPTVPKELIYLMFYFLDPWPVHNKYSTPKDDEDSLAREHWIHDGIEMATGVAKDAFINWPLYNTPAEGKWQSLGKTINPADLTIPTFIGVPAYDRVVPPLCAKPLTELIKNATLATSPSGHVGMIVGKNAKSNLWDPLANWLDGLR